MNIWCLCTQLVHEKHSLMIFFYFKELWVKLSLKHSCKSIMSCNRIVCFLFFLFCFRQSEVVDQENKLKSYKKRIFITFCRNSETVVGNFRLPLFSIVYNNISESNILIVICLGDRWPFSSKPFQNSTYS